MAFSGSGIFSNVLLNRLNNTISVGYQSATWKLALFSSTPTPDAEAAVSAAVYGSGEWLAAREITHTSGGAAWPTGGVTLANDGLRQDVGGSGNRVQMFADNVTQTSVTTTLAGSGAASAYGGLVYASAGLTGAQSNQGVSFIDFGGPFDSDNGNFYVTWQIGDSATNPCIWQLISL